MAVVVAVVVAVAIAVIKQSIVTLNLFQGLPVGLFAVAVAVAVPPFSSIKKALQHLLAEP